MITITNRDNAMKILRAVDLHEASFEITDEVGRYNRSMEDCFSEVFKNDPMKQIYIWSLDRYWNETIDICEEILKNTLNHESDSEFLIPEEKGCESDIMNAYLDSQLDDRLL